MNRKLFYGIALLVLCVACNKHKLFDGEPNFLTEDFEDVSSVDSRTNEPPATRNLRVIVPAFCCCNHFALK